MATIAVGVYQTFPQTPLVLDIYIWREGSLQNLLEEGIKIETKNSKFQSQTERKQKIQSAICGGYYRLRCCDCVRHYNPCVNAHVR